uniref:Uncharacterized protein n=1 Tax=Anguilla anguilla TaxID=7936 RepID=A0A0E9WWD5_ANGAN
MPMGWSPFGYGQYNMPYLPYQSLGQVGYPAATPSQPQNQPNYPIGGASQGHRDIDPLQLKLH